MNINLAKIALGFVVAAEWLFTGTKRGAERKAWVIKQLYGQLPDFVVGNITQDEFSALVDDAVADMKDLLQAAAE